MTKQSRKSSEPKPTRSKEELAKEVLAEKVARQQEGAERISVVLKELDLRLATVVQTGETAVTLDRVLVLPHQVMILAN